jgi:hypothetical protein
MVCEPVHQSLSMYGSRSQWFQSMSRSYRPS